MFNKFKKITKGLCALSVISLATVGTVQAQLGDAGAILRAGADDANTLMESYLAPYTKGFGAGLNTGWFNTAKAHPTLGFDISLNVSAAVIPGSDQIFDVSQLALQQLEVVSGGSETPTVAGDKSTNTEVGIFATNPQNGNREEVARFGLPGGSGFPYAPAPMIQASLGIVKDTDITLRYIPEFTAPVVDAGVGLFGVGVKHGINQWLPGGKLLPVDLSVQIGYNKFNANANFNVNPEEGSDIYNPYNASQWDGQGIDLETTATTYNAIVGKTVPFISVYGGIGFETSKTSLQTPGAYPVTSFNPNYDPNSNDPETREKRIESVESPIDLEIKDNNSMRAFAGLRFSLAVFRISASYTISNYSTFNVGVGFGLR
ncbi:DUF6588 family protein [Gracilimonas sp. BCB1]|uniref:DUF6588 family protein n=1 Tax=Gracilimonas sp. BCB1 TaxID=3152362 RepID=UPI0032D8E1C2